MIPLVAIAFRRISVMTYFMYCIHFDCLIRITTSPHIDRIHVFRIAFKTDLSRKILRKKLPMNKTRSNLLMCVKSVPYVSLCLQCQPFYYNFQTCQFCKAYHYQVAGISYCIRGRSRGVMGLIFWVPVPSPFCNFETTCKVYGRLLAHSGYILVSQCFWICCNSSL